MEPSEKANLFHANQGQMRPVGWELEPDACGNSGPAPKNHYLNPKKLEKNELVPQFLS